MNLKEAAAQAGVPLATACRWLDAGLVDVPGRVRRQRVPVPCDKKTVRELATLARLRGSGLSLQSLRHAADELRARGFNPFSAGIAAFAVVRSAGKRGRAELIRFITPSQAEQVSGTSGQMVIPIFGSFDARPSTSGGAVPIEK